MFSTFASFPMALVFGTMFFFFAPLLNAIAIPLPAPPSGSDDASQADQLKLITIKLATEQEKALTSEFAQKGQDSQQAALNSLSVEERKKAIAEGILMAFVIAGRADALEKLVEDALEAKIVQKIPEEAQNAIVQVVELLSNKSESVEAKLAGIGSLVANLSANAKEAILGNEKAGPPAAYVRDFEKSYLQSYAKSFVKSFAHSHAHSIASSVAQQVASDG